MSIHFSKPEEPFGFGLGEKTKQIKINTQVK
jgi:hypothetical protein